jgi:hypothetical protein
MTCSKRFAWLSIYDAVLFSSAHGIVLLTPISGCQTGQNPLAQARRARQTGFEIRNIGVCRPKMVNVIERSCERDAAKAIVRLTV